MLARRALPAAVALSTLLLLGGCGDDEPSEPGTTSSESTSPTATESSPTTDASPTEPTEPAVASVAVTVRGDSVKPEGKQVELGIGEPLVLKIDADREGELHVHSTPESYAEFGPGRSRVELTFDKPGQVDVEEHDSGTLVLRVLVR
jgi:hypothetical protein